MTLKVRDYVLASSVAFIAWGYLTSWLPILRFLGYAFVAGFSACLLLIGASVLSYAKRDHDGTKHTIARSRNAAFVAPEAWKESTEWLASKSIYRRTPLYPESFMISDAFDGLLDRLLRDFVTSWYSKITPSQTFVNEIERATRTSLIAIRDRVLGVDIVEVAVARLVPLITAHLKDFHEAEVAVRGKNLNRNVTESQELDVAIAGKYNGGKLHPAASLAYSDLKVVQQDYLRRIIVRVLPEVLPESMIGSRVVSVLIREIISCAVLAPMLQLLSDPDTWNQLMEAYGRTMLQDRKTVRKLRAALDQHTSPAPKSSNGPSFPRMASGDDERKFERFIRAIRQCNNLSEVRRFRSEVASQLKRGSLGEEQDHVYIRRLQTGKQMLDQKVNKLSDVGYASRDQNVNGDSKNAQGSSRLLNATIVEVLHDATGLSYFMEYMDRQRLMSFVQFWIVVDGFRNPLEEDTQTEDPFASNEDRWGESDRADIAQINATYLSKPELNVSEESKKVVRDFLKAGNAATMPQYLKARTVVLKAQSKVLQEMDEIHFPNFKKSDLYYKYLTSDNVSSTVVPRPIVRTVKETSIGSIPESPSRPAPLSRIASRLNASNSELRRNAASINDLKGAARITTDVSIPHPRRSLDIKHPGPLFDDDIEDEQMAQSTQSLDLDSINNDQASSDQAQMVEAMEAALNNIMTDDPKEDDLKDSIFDMVEPDLPATKIVDSPRSSGEFKRIDTSSTSDKDREKPNLASLGLVNTSSRIGVFSDNDLFGDDPKFSEDEQTDPEMSADEQPVEDEIHQAAPGDLGLAEAISALTADIERLAAQDSVVDTLTRKAELTNNLAELRILGKSKSSLQREIRRKELQRQQYIVQESDNSLYGRANVTIKSIMVGKEDDGQEFALYVIEVQRKAGDGMSAASWAVARRYSEFHDLHQRLRNIYPTVRDLNFPRRRLVMKLQRDFLHKRRVSLEKYLRELLRLPAVCRSRDLRAFLSQSAIVSVKGSSRDGERRDIISRIYNSVTDGMDEFLGNVPVLDQLSIAGQNLISAATSQFNTMPAAANGTPLPLAPEDPIQTAEARAELLAFEPNAINNNRADQIEPFVKPICDIFLEIFDLQRGNNWLRGRAVVVVLHQLLGGTVERKAREMARSLFAEPSVLKYINLLKDTFWPDGEHRAEMVPRTEPQKAQAKVEASVMLATLVPDLAGNVVGRANAQTASRRIFATVNNQRLNTHLAFTMLDEVIDVLFPRRGIDGR